MHTRRLATKMRSRLFYPPASTRQLPLAPAMAPRSPTVPCSGYTHGHKTKKRRRLLLACIRRRRCSNGSSEVPGIYQPSTLRKKTVEVSSLYTYSRATLGRYWTEKNDVYKWFQISASEFGFRFPLQNYILPGTILNRTYCKTETYISLFLLLIKKIVYIHYGPP